MYNRDAMAELKETLGNLSSVMDRLVDVVAKDETSKGIMDLLKEKAGTGKENKGAPPTSSDRVDTIYPTVARRGTGTGGRTTSGEVDLNYWQMSRLRTAFQALTGDMGAFQRTVLNTIVWANKASRVNAPGTAAEVMQQQATSSPIKNYKQAETWLMDKLIKEKGLGQGVKEFLDKTTPSGDKMLELLRAGVPVTMAEKMAQRQMREGIIKEAQEATRIPTPKAGAASAARAAASTAGQLLPTQFGGAGGTGGTVPPGIGGGIRGFPSGSAASFRLMSWGGMASLGAGLVIGSAPAVLGVFADNRKEAIIAATRLRYGSLSPEIATGLAQYDVAKLQLDIKTAAKIAPSFTSLLETAKEFDKSMEPFYTGLKKIGNWLEKGLMETVIGVNKVLDFVGGIVNPFNWFGPGQIPEPTWLDTGINAILGGVLGGAGKTSEKSRLDNITMQTPAGSFALEIANHPLAAPRRFVP